MARVSLKKYSLKKKNDAFLLVLSFIEQMNAHISIEDEQGNFYVRQHRGTLSISASGESTG